MRTAYSVAIATGVALALGATVAFSPSASSGPFGGAEPVSCGAGQDCSASTFTATSTGDTPFSVTAQLECAVDVGPGANDCFGTDSNGFITLPTSAVLDVGTTRVQNAQVLITNGYLTLANSGIRRLAADAVPVEGGVRHVAMALGTCASALEFTVRADNTSGGTTGARSQLCVCTSDGGATPAYAWVNLASGTVGTATTCPP